MSFSAEVKEELSKIHNLAKKDLVKAELIGYLISSNVSIQKNKLQFVTENEYNINRFHKLLSNLEINYQIKVQRKGYAITFPKQDLEEIQEEEQKIKITRMQWEKHQKSGQEELKKAVIRGAFQGSGSFNNPNKLYHFEIVFHEKENADYIMMLLEQFGIQAKSFKRQKKAFVYLKEAEEISKCLALLGANKAVLKFEEIRVVRETRNSINRLVNCETANLNKTINAAVEQIEAIKLIKKKKRFEELTKSLKEIAEVRIKYPDVSLVELGKKLENPIGKSGVNHRLKRICEIAEELEEGKK